MCLCVCQWLHSVFFYITSRVVGCQLGKLRLRFIESMPWAGCSPGSGRRSAEFWMGPGWDAWTDMAYH